MCKKMLHHLCTAFDASLFQCLSLHSAPCVSSLPVNAPVFFHCNALCTHWVFGRPSSTKEATEMCPLCSSLHICSLYGSALVPLPPFDWFRGSSHSRNVCKATNPTCCIAKRMTEAHGQRNECHVCAAFKVCVWCMGGWRGWALGFGLWAFGLPKVMGPYGPHQLTAADGSS